MSITNGEKSAFIVLTNYGILFIPNDDISVPTMTKLDGKLDVILPCSQLIEFAIYDGYSFSSYSF